MATVTVQIKDTTKVGKSLINIATELASKYKSISIIESENIADKVDVKKQKFLQNFENAIIETQQIKKERKQGKRKGLTEKELFDELL